MFYTLIPTDHRAGQYSSNQPQQPVPFCVDILDQGEGYRMEAELPGFRKEDISLTIKEDVLTIAAHREEEQHVGQYVCRERGPATCAGALTCPPSSRRASEPPLKTACWC